MRLAIQLLLVFVPMSLVPLPASGSVQGCAGCAGAGGSGSATAPCGTMSISVTVESGRCRWLYQFDPPEGGCVDTKRCTPSITRSWSGLPANTALSFCVKIGNDRFCLEDPPDTGPSGSGSDLRTGPIILCGQSVSFELSSAGCAGLASATGACSSCTPQ